jgi:RNA polymerase sigma factor (sigma-70 family)
MATISADELLRRYRECDDPARSEALLEELLVEHAQPAIRKIVRYRLAAQGPLEAQDIDDVVSEVLAELIGRLRALKEHGPEDAIGAFSGYSAVAAYHACHEYLRRKYPNRHRLKNRLRYLLNSEKVFAIWEGDGGDWWCGLATWQLERREPASGGTLARWQEKLADLPRGLSQANPAGILARVFEQLGGPVPFDDLVGMMGYLWGVEDIHPAPEQAAREIESTGRDAASQLELKQWLGALWREICDLPQPQRVALLLNLRSGPAAPAAVLLPLAGIAGITQIAEVLGLTPEELARLWPQLPLEDLAIAERLGVTRQRVINLRKSARERLIRRMGGKYHTT